MSSSEVVSTKGKQRVQVAAEDGKEDVEQQETPSVTKEDAPQDKDKDEECEVGDDDTTKLLIGTTDDISLTQELNDEAPTDNSVSSESTSYMTSNTQ